MDFSETYQQYFKDIYRYIYSLCNNTNIAEEITQETFFKALKNIDKYDGQKDIKAWLISIAKNTYFTYCKRNKIYVDYELDNSNSQDSLLIENVINNESNVELHKYIHSMQEPYKEVVSLRIFAELSYEEIGQVFNKSPVWARVTFYRAKKQIINYFEGRKKE